jgi:hypothetical protein
MNREAILSPFFAMIALTVAVWFYMYAQRLPFILRSRLTPQQLRPEELARRSPPAVANPSDNLKNLFELPTIFYALVLCLYVTDHVDATYLWAAWLFVVFRILHSAVHCTFNFIPLRFWLYAAGALSLWFMAGRAALMLVGGRPI